MARLPRLTVSGFPHHVIMRGNNRQPIFLGNLDRERMLALMEQHSLAQGVHVHAYVLMDNHFHLLLTPQKEGALPTMMQAIGRSYVRLFNQTHGRSGTLWEGRYRSTLVQSERYLLACMVYIDLNPVRAGMVEQAADHPWSSHAHYRGLRVDRLIMPHPLFWTLGNTPFEREAAYAELVRAGLSAHQQSALTDSALSGWALGEADFIATLQEKSTRRLQKSKPGRPRLSPKKLEGEPEP
ncbi:MAG: transposase [Betaproteobacteria bacterium]|nr:transposase [Betaproteobacteria bacterium]NBY04686.1 transposase [Betaproteobacteria bacterium]